MSKPVKFNRTVIAAMAFASVATAGFAQDVTLVGKSSAINIEGELLGVENGRYVIRTALGILNVDQSTVDCVGSGCPGMMRMDLEYDVQMAGPTDISETLLPVIADGFAATLDAEALVLDGMGMPMSRDAEMEDHEMDHSGQIGLQFTSFDGEPIARFAITEAEGEETFELLASGEASVVFTGEPASQADIAMVAQAGGGQLDTYEQERVVAVDGFAVIVHPDNEVPTLTVAQVAAIYAGEITNWFEVGGARGPISVYTYEDETEQFHEIEELVLEPAGVELSDDANIVRTTRELTRAVSRDPFGLGVVGYSSTRGTRAIPLTNECGMIVPPTPFNIKTEEYPLGHRVFAYSRSDATGYAVDLLEFMDGTDMDGLVSKAGFVDLSVETDERAAAIDRMNAARAVHDDEYEQEIMDELLAGMDEHYRLSTTFRFAPGARRLDNKGERDLQRLVAYFAEEKPDDVLVVGFTDSNGGFDANMNVAEDRAELILDALLEAADGALDDVEMHSAGYGELAPVACNSSAQGRAINRRVEIWVEK